MGSFVIGSQHCLFGSSLHGGFYTGKVESIKHKIFKCFETETYFFFLYEKAAQPGVLLAATAVKCGLFLTCTVSPVANRACNLHVNGFS